MTHCRGHAPDLAVAALGEHDFDPGGGHRLAKTDRRRARPQFGLDDAAHLRRTGAPAIEHDTAPQVFEFGLIRLALDLRPVGLGKLVARVGEAVLQRAVVGE